jgi:hypothetical protein
MLTFASASVSIVYFSEVDSCECLCAARCGRARDVLLVGQRSTRHLSLRYERRGIVMSGPRATDLWARFCPSAG